ncbi:hypothetical protein DJ73_17460 [Halorubrum sp. Ea1]|nr:hypothetical protein DJ73_17460 [Halorubrum sp. Ea1]
MGGKRVRRRKTVPLGSLGRSRSPAPSRPTWPHPAMRSERSSNTVKKSFEGQTQRPSRFSTQNYYRIESVWPNMEHPNVLVFVEFPDPDVPTTGFLKGFKYPDAEVVGFYHLDDGESPEDARAERGDEFTSELEEIAERFEREGVRADHDLVFGHDRVAARQQIVERDAVDAILLPGAANTLGKVLIAARSLPNAERKATLLDIVAEDELLSVDLVHIADPDDPDGESEGQRILKQTASALADAGVPEMRINRTVRTGTDVAFELSQAARGYDLIVLGETERDLGDRIFGPIGEYIVDERDVPVLILR